MVESIKNAATHTVTILIGIAMSALFALPFAGLSAILPKWQQWHFAEWVINTLSLNMDVRVFLFLATEITLTLLFFIYSILNLNEEN